MTITDHRTCATTHPSYSCYNDHGCRCDPCKGYNAARSRRWRHAQGPPERRRWHPTSISDQYNCTITLDEYRRIQAA